MRTRKGKVVLVTGGSRGIGKAIVHRFKEEGWQVATCATQDQHLKKIPADFKFKCNVTSPQQVKQVVEQVIEALGKINVLVNNAGLAGNNPLQPKASDELWHRILDTNLNGTYYFCKYAAPYLPDKTGKVINISSVLGLKGVANASAYCAAKHGVIGLTRALAHDFAPRNITVNAICPGWTRTEMAMSRLQEIGMSEKDLGTSVPLGRFIEPEEIADFVFFLASSKASSMITGQALTIDGGTLP